MSPLKTMLIAVCLLASSACGTPQRVALTQAFPPSPVDLKSPLPALTPLPKVAALSDIAKAHNADAKAFADLLDEVKTWRAWWSAEAAKWAAP